MTVQNVHRYKALLLILLAIFFAQKYVSGKLYFYIAPRFSWLAVLSMALLIILAGAYRLVGRTSDDHLSHQSHTSNSASVITLAILAIPLLLGTLVPSQPLGASAVSSRGVSTVLSFAADREAGGMTAPSQRTVLDWVRVMSETVDPDALNGQAADIVGFVYRDVRFATDQFMVGRFAITCCVADALAIGVVATTADAQEYTQDTWVRVHGVFQKGEIDGQSIPVLYVTEIERVQQPEQPYLYP